MYVWLTTDCTLSCVLYRFMLVSTVPSSYLVMDLSKLVERFVYIHTQRTVMYYFVRIENVLTCPVFSWK